MTFDLNQALTEAELLYMHNDDMGSIRVLSNHQYMWLQLNDTVHTLMSRQTPDQFILPHLHAMAMAMYITPGPINNALELGLGGGAMSRFLHGTYGCQVTSIELNPAIIHCFQTFFNPEGYDFDIIQGDVEKEIQRQGTYDLVIGDLYGENSVPEFLSDQGFYHRCLQSVSEQGTLMLNLLPSCELYQIDVEQKLETLLGHRPICLSVPGYRNRILLCSRQAEQRIEFEQGLLDFCQQYHIDLNQFVQL